MTDDSDCTYLPVDLVTGCYTRRSCSQCLQKPGCQIGYYGICQSPYSWSSDEYNFTHAFERNLTLPAMKNNNASALTINQMWEFPAGKVSYCPADDVVCNQCIQDKFWLPAGGYRGDSRFCVGASGCICVYNCEFNDMEPPQCVGPISAPTPSPTPQNCLSYPADPVTGCRRWRPCSNCLEVPGCRVGTDGFCEPDSTSGYDNISDFDYRLAIQRNLTLPVTNSTNVSALDGPQNWMFPAESLTYCSADDTVCKQCIADNFWLSPGEPLDSRFCVGEDGCVCVAACSRSESVVTCPSPVPEYVDDSAERWRNFSLYMTLFLAAILIVGCTCCLCLIRCCVNHRRARRQAPLARIITTSPTLADQALPYAVLPTASGAASNRRTPA